MSPSDRNSDDNHLECGAGSNAVRPTDAIGGQYSFCRHGDVVESERVGNRHFQQCEFANLGGHEGLVAVAVLTVRELLELGDRQNIFFVKNLKPGRGIRLEYWGFPLLEKRRAMSPPPVRQLPTVPDIVFPTSPPSGGTTGEWRRDNGLRFPIDPDDFN